MAAAAAVRGSAESRASKTDAEHTSGRAARNVRESVVESVRETIEVVVRNGEDASKAQLWPGIHGSALAETPNVRGAHQFDALMRRHILSAPPSSGGA